MKLSIKNSFNRCRCTICKEELRRSYYKLSQYEAILALIKHRLKKKLSHAKHKSIRNEINYIRKLEHIKQIFRIVNLNKQY